MPTRDTGSSRALTETVPPRSPAATQTLTFLFADLRDYTRFVEQFGDAAATTLIADYRRIVRGEVAKAGGAEVKTEGDSFYVVFPSARSAVATAIEILREAERYSKDRPDRPMRVGVGIHAGEPVPHEGQYVGSAVIVAARLAQSAAAGELLVSEVVRALLPKHFAPPTAVREGLTLKGIDHAPMVFAVSWQQVAAPTAAPSEPLEVAIEAAPPSRRILCPDVIGRDAELAALEAFHRETAEGQGRTVLVGGEAGVGKSAVLRTFLAGARDRGSLVLVGECSEIEARRPFGPIVDALAAAGLPLPEDLRAGGPGAQSVSEMERYRAHAALTATLAELASSRPAVLAVEDLHWADEATLELVPYLARRLRASRVLVLGTYRTDELHRTHPLSHLLAELARSRLAEEVRLRKLTEDETAALIRGALGLGRAPTTAFRRAIYERCEGNPFFTEEVLRALVERGDLAYRDGAWRRTKEVAELAIPVSIRDAVQQRLRALDPGARRIVQVAAVIGQRFEFELLERVSGQREGEVLEALRSSIDEQLIEEEPGDEGEWYRFRHALTRETVLAELLHREQRLLHRAVGEAIEAATRDPVERMEELAYHFDEARDAARAYRYRDLAARESVRLLAFPRALRHLERVVELAPDDDPALGSLLIRLSDAASQMNELDRAARAAGEALALFERRGDGRGTGAALSRLARAEWQFGRSDRAMELARRAVEVLEPLGASPELAAAYEEVARLQMVDVASSDAAIASAERAIAIADAVGDVAVATGARVTRATARAHADPDEGVRLLRESLRAAQERGLVREALRAYHNLAGALLCAGATQEELRAVHDEGMRYLRRYGVESEAAILRESFLGFIEGDWDRAVEVAETYQSGTIWSKVREAYGSFIRLTREGPDPWLRSLNDLARSLAAAKSPQWVSTGAGLSALARYVGDDARGALDSASPILAFVEEPAPGGLHIAAMVAVRGARELGDRSTEREWLAWLETAPAHGTFRRGRGAFLEAVGAVGRKDTDAAVAAFRQVAELDGVMPFSFVSTTLVRKWSAELLLAKGDRAGAQSQVDPIVPFWRRVNATWYLGRLAEWAHERGLTVGS